MYTDTRVRSADMTLRTDFKYDYFNLATGDPLPWTSWINVETVTRQVLAQSITSVRGPKPSGRLLCNPAEMQKVGFHVLLDKDVELVSPKMSQNLNTNPPSGLRFRLRNYPYSSALFRDPTVFQLVTAPPDLMFKDREYALQKAYAKANESTANIMVTIGELRETLSMLRNPLAGLRKFLVTLARRQTKSRKTVAEDVAKDTWMEYRYGIMPLIFDTQSLIEAYKAKAQSIFKHEATVRRREPVSVTYRKLFLGGVAYQNFWFEVSDVFKTTAGLYTNPVPLDRFGTKATQLLPAALELVPYSFVLNWFVDVDAWLNALMGSVQIHPFTGFVTFKSSRQVRVTPDGPVLWSGGHESPAIPSYSLVREAARMQRTTNLAVDLSTVHFNNAFTNSWRRMVDSVALIWKRPSQIIKNFKR